MEYKDPLFELLNSLEQIVFKDEPPTTAVPARLRIFSDPERLRKDSGLQPGDFANAMGVSIAQVREWESGRVKPSVTEFKLMRLIVANPQLSRQLLD